MRAWESARVSSPSLYKLRRLERGQGASPVSLLGRRNKMTITIIGREIASLRNRYGIIPQGNIALRPGSDYELSPVTGCPPTSVQVVASPLEHLFTAFEKIEEKLNTLPVERVESILSHLLEHGSGIITTLGNDRASDYIEKLSAGLLFHRERIGEPDFVKTMVIAYESKYLKNDSAPFLRLVFGRKVTSADGKNNLTFKEPLTPDDIRDLKLARDSISSLELGVCSDLSMLEGFNNLESLRVKALPGALESLPALSNLKRLSATNIGPRERVDLSALSQSKNLEELYLFGFRLALSQLLSLDKLSLLNVFRSLIEDPNNFINLKSLKNLFIPSKYKNEEVENGVSRNIKDFL